MSKEDDMEEYEIEEYEVPKKEPNEPTNENYGLAHISYSDGPSPDGYQTLKKDEYYIVPRSRPPEEAVKRFLEKQQFRDEVYKYHGVDPNEDIYESSSNEAINAWKRNNGGVEPSTTAQKNEVNRIAAMVMNQKKDKIKNIERRFEDAYKMKMEQEKAEAKIPEEQRYVNSLHERARNGDMEAWNQLYLMTKKREEDIKTAMEEQAEEKKAKAPISLFDRQQLSDKRAEIRNLEIKIRSIENDKNPFSARNAAPLREELNKKKAELYDLIDEIESSKSELTEEQKAGLDVEVKKRAEILKAHLANIKKKAKQGL